MAVDTAAHIGNFDLSKPSNSDAKSEGDDNFRHVKTVLKTDFAYITGPVTATHTELNYVSGVTSAIQTQLDAKAPIASPTFTDTPSVPTAAVSTNTTQAASTAFVQAAIAAVNATSGVSHSTSSAVSFSVTAGQIVAATNASAVAVTFPASPTSGTVCGVIFDNGLTTNTVDLCANAIKHNGTVIGGVITNGARVPVVLRWGGDYWRFI